jgi:putative ABC transport system permease protein
MQKEYKPPKHAEWLLAKILPVDDHNTSTGDFEEYYIKMACDSGIFIALLWYYRNIFFLFPRKLKHTIWWSSVMFRNYVKIAFRNILRNKLVSSINLLGLTLGMACSIVILLWVQDELSYDSFHIHANELYRVAEVQTYSGKPSQVARTPTAIAPVLIEEIPEVVNAMRMFPAPSLMAAHGEKRFYEDGIIFASPSILSMFTFPVLEGDGDAALHDASSVVITQETAQKYFGDANPLHQILSINNKYDFTVGAVIQNVPENSQMQFDIILPLEALVAMGPDMGIRWSNVLENWGINFIFTYIQTTGAADPTMINEKILNFIPDHSGIEGTRLYLQPLRDIHLHSNLMADFEGNGDATYVRIFTIIAFLILLTACINFMNLSTAQSGKRSKEVGMRKIAGANRIRIMRQFFSEYIFLTLFAFLIAIVVVLAFLPTLNHLSGKTLSFNAIYTPGALTGLVVTLILTGFLSGMYPAFILSGFQPVQAIRRSMSTGPRGRLFRRILVVFQFMISIALIIATLIMHSQLDFIRHSKLGFDRERVVWMRLRGDSNQFYQSLKNELMQNAHIRGVTAADQLPTQIIYSWNGADWPGKDPDDPGLMNAILIDFDFIETMGIQIADGRAFSNAIQSDRDDAFILNQKAIESMGLEDPLGKTFSFIGRRGRIVGIVADFQFETFYHDIKPLVMMHSEPRSDHYMIVRLGDDISTGLKFIEETWNHQVFQYPFECGFLDEQFDQQYRKEMRMGTLFNYFSTLALCIAFLGLFGLVTFETERRTKEIGIRKALGASVHSVILLLTKELVILIMAANLIAWPVAYFLMNQWLQNFARHSDLRIWVFLFAGLITLSVAILTVAHRTLRAARANPVDSLRYE